MGWNNITFKGNALPPGADHTCETGVQTLQSQRTTRAGMQMLDRSFIPVAIFIDGIEESMFIDSVTVGDGVLLECLKAE